MDDLAVIRATFADWRTVKGRKQLQLIFEIPIEQQAEVLTRLGAPNTENPKWCAIALLDTSSPPKAEANAAKSEQGRVRYLRMPTWEKAAMRAVMLCKDKKFWQWIDSQSPDDWCDSEEKAADALRLTLNVKSRKDIATEERAFKEFIKLESEFRAATGQMAEVRG